jgi:putative phage-type endonuclease
MTDTTTLVQGSDEWKAARCGSLGGSRLSDMLAKTKTGWGAMRGNLMADLVAERLTGVMAEGYQSEAMARGSEVEADARRAYAFRTGNKVAETGLWRHPRIAGAHASPDGLVGDDGLLELKCPMTKAHIDTLRGGSIPGTYQLQMLWEMACTGRTWCDYVSFDPRLPESMSLHIKRVHLDADRLREVESEVLIFLREVDETVADLRRLYESGTLADQLKASVEAS